GSAGGEAFLRGGPSGRLLAPYPLIVSDTVVDEPVAVAVGAFGGGAEADAVVAATPSGGEPPDQGRPTLWDLPRPPRGPSGPPGRLLLPSSLLPRAGLVAVGPLVAGGPDVAVFVGLNSPSADVKCDQVAALILLVRFGDAAPPLATSGTLVCPTSVQLVDADG